MNSFKLRLQSLWSAALAFGVLLAAPAVFGQAVFFDFNTPGQLTNNFGVRNKTAGQAAVWHETNSFGVNNTRALEGVIGSGNFNTLTYLGDGFPFPVNDGATLNMSIFYRGKVSSQAGPVAQMLLGLIGYSNNVAIATNNFIEGNSVVSWLNLRTSVSGTTGLGFEYGIYMTTNNGNAFNTTTFEYSNKTTTAIGVVNATWTNWYKLSATFVRTNQTNVMFTGMLDSYGTFGTAFQSNVMTLAPTVVTGRLSFPTTVYPAFEAIENAGVDNIDNFAVWMTNGAARVTAPPTSQAISTYRSATFVAKSDGTPPIAYTWYTNGVIVGGGATNASYTTPILMTAGSIAVYVAVTNAIDGADSSATPATLTVTADATAPSVVSVGSLDGRTIGVAFSETMDLTSATTPGNYSVTGGTVTNAALRPDGRVALTLSAAISGAFTVTVSGVTDLAGNPLSGNSAGGTVLGLTPTDVGAPLTTGSSFSSSQGDIDQVGGGLDFSNLADQGHFAGGVRTGDFDIRVRVQGLQRPRGTTIFTGRDEGAQAGIVAKENFDPGSRMMRAYTSPLDTGMPVGSNTIGSVQRTTTLGAAANIATPLAKPSYTANGYFPNMWLRLRRVNNTFTTYYETNAIGSNWIQYGQATATMTPNMVVGPATFPRTDEYNLAASAQYRTYGDWSVVGATLGFAINLAATTTINITAPVTNAVTSLTVTATNTGTIFPSNEIHFVWQRSDGFGGFTNIPGQAAQPSSTPFTNSAVSTFTTPNLNPSDSGTQFRVIARGPGGLSATSAVNTVIVNYLDTTTPAVTGAWIPYLSSNTLALTFNVPLDITTISNVANYKITNSLGQTITITGVIFEQGAFSTQGVTRVILVTSTPLTNGPLYSVIFNIGLRGTNGTPIALNTTRTVGFGTIKVELWDNLGTGTHITNDFLNQAKVLSNAADHVFFTNVFSFNHNGASFNDTLNTYGGRISAWFIAPSNGTYRFHIRNDDAGQLYFNPNGPDPAGKILVAYQPTANAAYGATLNTNMSANFVLVSNQAYYIEGIWKENGGGDGFGLAFRESAVAGTPATTEITDGRFFYPIPTSVPVPILHNLVSMTNTYPSAFNIGQHGLMGPVRVEIFTNSGAGTTATFTNSPAYLANNPYVTMWTNVFGFSTNLTDVPFFGNNYGGRLSAYFVAPSNAFYRFYLKSDDGSTFAMNTNGTLPSGKSVLATLGGFRNSYATNDGSVTPAISLTNGQWYYIEALWAEGTGGDGIGVAWRGFPDITAATNSIIQPGLGECVEYSVLRPIPVAPNFQLGYQLPIQAELYTGIGGITALTELTQNPKYVGGFPDFVIQPGYFGFKRDLNGVNTLVGDNYGARISAYFVPPTNGFYRLYLKDDDSSQIFMNTNAASGMDYAGRVSVASLGSFRATYATNDGSISPALNLVAGVRYYMEVLMKEGGGGDGVGVALRGYATATQNDNLPAATEFIPYTFFAPITGPVTANNIVQSPAGSAFGEGQVINFSVTNVIGAMPIAYQWKKNGVPIPGANGNNVNVTLTNIDNGVNTYSVSIYNPQSVVEKSINLAATVTPDSAPPFITAVVGNGLQNEVTVTFSENVLPSTATNTANYSIAGLTITGAFLRAANQVALITSPQTAGTRYTVVVNNVRDFSRLSNVIVPGSSFDFTSWNLQRGFVTVDLFTGLNNNTFVDALVGEPKFIWNTPDSTQYRPFFGFGSIGGNGGTDFADNYGARVYGWFIAPSNGQYRFYIRSDDQSELFMNTNSVNSTDPAGKVGIAGSTLACCGVTYADISKGPVISPNIALAAGQLYYMEALFKEGGGGDGVAVAFREAGDLSLPPITETIPGYFFASLGNPDITANFTITNHPVSASLQAGQLTTLRVGALAMPAQFIAYQWQWLNGAVWTDVGANTNLFGTNFAFTTTFTSAGTFQYRALAIVPGYMRTSSVATITVTNAVEAVPAGPIVIGASTTNGIFVRAFFNEPVTEPTATNVLNYLLTNHLGSAYTVTNAVLLSDAQTVVLAVSTRLTPGNLTNYTLVASGVVDVDDAIAGGGAYTFYAPDGVFHANVYQQAGVSLTAFPLSTPSTNSVVSNSLLYGSGNLNGGADAGNPYISANIDTYVARLSGFIIPASNGLYQFWLSSDDGSQFFMNTNSVNSDSPTGMVQLLAAGAFNTFASFAPTPYITLRAGQRYYFEGRLQDGSGGDAFAVTMRESRDPSPLIGPFRTAPPLSASNQLTSLLLSSPPQLTLVPTPSLAPSFVEDATNLVLGTVIGTPAYIQWYSNNVLIAGATNATFPLPSPLPLSYNGATVQVIATNFFSGVISNQFSITVTADSTAPTITGIFRDSTGTNIIINFSELVNSNSAVTLGNYALSDGSPVTIVSVRLRPDGRSVIISIAPSGGLNPSTAYTVTVNNVTDRAATPNTIVAASTASTPALTLTTGFLAVDLFTNISANAGTAIQITNLFNDARFINNQPDLQTTIGSLDFHTTNMPWAGILNYGAKIHGWFTPPATAVYRFYWRSDDFSQLFMNTNGATPSGKVQIGGPVGSGQAYASSTSVSLTMGTAYYIEWDMAQGTGNEYFQATWRSFANATAANAAGAPIAPGTPGTGWPNAIYPSAEVAAGANFGLYGDASTVSNLNITLQPTPSATNIGANTLVSFSVGATNDGANKYLFYQWQADNGAGTFTNLSPLAAYTSDYAMLGNRSNYSAVFGYSATLRVVATLPGGLSVTSSTATVTVTNAYNFFTAGSLGGTNTVVLTFDKPLDAGSVSETSNFVVNEGAVSVTSATQTGRTVTVNLSAPISGEFRVQVFQVLDATLAFLTPDDGSSSITLTGRVMDASFVNDVGSAPGTTDPLVRGSAVSLAPNSLDITAGGTDIFGTSDGMYYVARQITGNFDVRVRVLGLTNFYRGLSDANAKASITARPLTNGNSRSISATIAPPVIPSWPVAGANGAQFIFRDTVGGSSTAVTLGSAWQTPLGPWIRLVRNGSGFFAFRSLDGTNWVLISSRDTAFNGGAYPDTIFVGFGATSHNNVTNVTPGTIVANLRDIYFPLVPTITSQPTGATNGLGANITLTVTATNPPNSGALTYQWRRSGTNLIGSTGSSFSITGANVSDSGAYTVLVGNDGGGVISSNAIVLITNALPTVASETVGAVQNVTTNYTPGTLLANNTDPEGRPLSIAAVSGIFPVTFYTDFEAGLPAGTAIFGSAHLAASVGVTNSQALALTDAVGNQSGAFIISNLVPGRSVSAFSAAFQIRIGGGSGNPADGMSFNLASDLPTDGNEDGVGSGLSICLDNYDNGNLEAPALGIKWRGVYVTHVPIPKVNSTAWQPVLVTLRANGTIDVSVNGAALISNFQTPYTPITGASFGFYARTGGEFETHWLDEIGITVLTPETTTSGLTTSYSSDFTYGLPPGMTLYGLTNAYWTNLTGVGNSGALHLNDTVNNAAGAAVIDEIVTNRPVYSFTANFKLRIASGAEGADGMSFNFANDLPNAVSGGAEEGVGTGLSLCFDIYRFPDNAGTSANRSGLKLKYRGNTIAQVQTPVWNSASYIPVVMLLSANGVVTVSVDGTNAFANVPTSYVPSRGRFGFYARTGGANETHWIDDLNIVLPDNGYVTLAGTNVNYLPPRNGCGTDTFYYQVSDGQGGLAWDSATVQLLDVTAPTVLQTATNRTIFFTSCSNTLPNLTLTAVSGLVVTDACSLTLTQSPLAGTLMGTGVTVVTITAVDAGTNLTTITTFVTNRDNTIPTISCPANVVVLSDPGFCYASGVSLGSASASDNCLIAVTNNAPTPFPVGITIVTWTAVDMGGNTNACTQTVTVIDPAAANVAAYEPFVCYTEGSLNSQTVRGTGFAGSWSSGGGDVLVTNAASLTYVSGSSILGVEGGRAFTPAAGFNTMFAGMNTNLSGAFSNLMDGGRIGGPNASGTLYFSFLARNASGDLTGADDFAGLELFDDGAEVLGIGNNFAAWAYSLFGISGDVDLTNNAGGFFSMNANTHLFVARIDYASGGDDTVTVWMDPDIAASEAGQGNLYRRTFTGNARFNRIALRSGSNNNDNSWDFDEIRFGSSWGNVTPSGIAITTQPASQTANCGSTVNFTVGTASLVTSDYRWSFNGNLISGATNSTLSRVSVSTNDVGSYTVIVSNRFGSLTSSVATLTVTNTPSLISPAGPLLGGVLDNACGSLVLAGGSAYRWELTNATGSAGSGWDVLNVTGGIDVQATTGNPFIVNLWSLNGSVAGPAANWNNDATNVFTIATVTDAVTNFSADKFTLNDANFANDLAGGVFSIEEGSLKVKFTPNHAPVANASTNNRAPGLTLKIKITNLLATATSDVDGDGRALIGLGASTNGATITTNADYIFYSGTNNLAEAIIYTVRDLRSYRAGDTVRTAAALLYFTTEAPTGTNGNAVTISFTNGVVGMRFAGIPGYTYNVQRTEDLTPPATWTTLHTTNCPPLGLFDFIDTAPPMGAAYYRTAQP